MKLLGPVYLSKSYDSTNAKLRNYHIYFYWDINQPTFSFSITIYKVEKLNNNIPSCPWALPLLLKRSFIPLEWNF